ncbi:MAG: RNA polymerase sigma-70 factor [Bacteroidales bacterium]
MSTEAEFKEIFNLYFKDLVAVAYVYTRDMAVSEDIVQDLFLNLWEKKQGENYHTSLKSYLFIAVKNRCLNYLRKEGRKRDYIKSTKSTTSEELACSLELKDTQSILDKSLKQLPEKSRKIFLLNRFSDKSYQEIADDLEISKKTVEFHISKVLKCLREVFKTNYIIDLIFFRKTLGFKFNLLSSFKSIPRYDR